MIKRNKGLQRKVPLVRRHSIKSATAGITGYSKPRQAQIREYNQLKRKFFENGEDHICEINAPGGCLGTATDWHHPEGRAGAKLLEINRCKKTCRYCHDYCHDHPEWAITEGHSSSRL